MKVKWFLATFVAFQVIGTTLSATFKFTKSRYNVSFYENTITMAYGIPSERMGISTGNLLFNAAPTIRYKIIRGMKSADNYFKAEARQIGNFCFLLIRTKTGTPNVLNRERNSHYKFSVRATMKSDTGDKEIAETEVHVTVLDDNDLKPIFFPSAYEATIPIDMPLHRSIVKVTAEDADVGINGEIYYSFREATDLFAIHPITGIVTLTRPLLENDGDLYELTVCARDRGPRPLWQQSDETMALASLRIVTVPVNLHDPVIIIEELSNVIEQSHADIYAIVHVSDPDEEGGSTTLEIVDGDTDGIFKIRKGRNPNEFYVEMLKLIDRERTPWGYNLTLRATDGGKPPRSSAETLKVVVSDSNDNPPVFEKHTYKVEIKEIAPVGTQLLRLKVTDSDMGKNAQVIFAIAGGNEHECFRVNPQTGVLYIASPLDAEIRSEYTLTISALDQGNLGTRKQSSAKVHIKVIDCNDNDPVFPSPSLDIDVDENEPVGAIITHVSAKDPDSGENGYISYSIANIMPTPFEIDPFTGIIKANEILDYEGGKRKYVINVRASDWGTPYRRQSELTLTISVRDINDNKPQFLTVDCSGKISRNSPYGTELITLSAVDFDDKGTVTYRLISGNEDGCFSLDAITGTIAVSCDLTDVGASERTLNITASDGQYYSDVTSISVILTGSRKRTDLNIYENRFSCNESPAKKIMSEIEQSREKLFSEKEPSTSSARFSRNLYSPEFVDFPSQIRINESALVGTPLLKLEAMDADHGYNGLIVFAISSGNDDSSFDVDTETGWLKVAAPLDREHKAGYVLNITIYDLGNPQKSTWKLLPITVTDINDNPPKFENPIITATISEKSVVGETVARLFASDTDENDNAKITYHLLTDTDDFRLDPHSGLLTVSAPLDREQNDYYELLIMARDMGDAINPISPVLTSQAMVRVKILDVNDNKPSFSSNYQVVKIREDIPIGSVVAIISATDPDLGKGGEIKYSIEPTYPSENLDRFLIDSKTGTIRLNRNLDYEERQIYNITVKGEDHGEPHLSSTSVLVVEVVDVNENVHRPKFEELVTNFTVKENEPVSTVVGKVVAVDFDPPGEDSRVAYSILDGDGFGYFSIDREGIIRTRCSLDRETKPYFWLTVVAVDRGVVPFSASIEVFIEVENVNDHIPLTEEPIYFTSVKEHSPAGALVLRISAVDGDGPNEKFRFQLKGDPQSFFSIDRHTGEIRTTSRSLDRETQTEHILEVVVSDQGSPVLSSSTRIVVTVEDINDNAPQFLQNIYKFSVPSRAVAGEEIGQVLAFDKDSGINSEIEYSLAETGKSGKPRFSVDPVLGTIHCLRPLQARYDFNIRAIDKGTPSLSSTTHVIVTIIDIPETSPNRPKVLEYVNHIFLDEEQPVGTLVTGIYAEDGDGDHLWFLITDGNANDTFAIDNSSGQIYVRKALDAESFSSYNLTVVITDGSNPVEVHLWIEVMDTNDNFPVFSKSIYDVEVCEGTEVGTEVLLLQASDRDRNTRLIFAIHTASSASSLRKFKVEENGRIVLAEKLDRELMHQHTLIVSVQDNGLPALRNFARVNIQVRDDNDHAPAFPSIITYARVLETAAVGSTVAHVVAIDRDKGENAKITYSLSTVSGGSEDMFGINADTGQVFLEKSLDASLHRGYSLQIRAVDGGRPPLSSICTLHVNVVLADNAPPRFTKDVYEADVLESSPIGYVILGLETTSASSPLYEITSGDPFDNFFLNPTAGTLTVASYLDYEIQQYYNLTVLATNMAGLKATAIIIINVRDVNDNAPRFLSFSYEGIISEAAPVEAVVYAASSSKGRFLNLGSPLILEVDDDDSGVNAQITYEILDSLAKAYFTIDPSTGAVKTLSLLDYESYPEFDFAVRISDKGSPKLISENSAHVIIRVEDVNDCPPKFSQQVYNATLFVPTYPGVYVTELKAVDADSTDSQLRYSIVAGNIDNKFSIGSKSGIVTVANGLLKPFYQLDITVTDGHYASATVLTIYVDTIKNYSLSFAQEVYSATIVENSTKVQRVAILQVVGSELHEHIFFSILNPSDMFSIGRTSGVVYTTGKPFDREVTDECDVFVEAKVEGGAKVAHTTVKVTIEDVNDNKPIFVNQPYHAIVKTSAQKGDVIGKVLAVDRDINENGDIRYELLRGNGEFFKVAKKTGEILLRQTPHNHNADYELTIVAYDEGSPGLSSEASVQIKVVDRSSPIFEQPFYYSSIREDTPLYTPLLSVSALNPTDRKLIYTITSGNDMEEFTLDFETAHGTGNTPCVLTLVAPLDYEQRQHYELSIRALDSVSGIYSDVIVAVDVLDVNDNFPEFMQSVYNVTVSELTSIGSQVTKIKAFDIDSGDNGKVFYQLVRDPDSPEKFRINEDTGVITLIKPLDYETQRSYHLTGVVTDLGIPPFSTSVHIWITVKDENDNPPRFESKEYSFLLNKYAKKGAFLGVVKAWDPDWRDQPKLKYMITGGNDYQNFEIEEGTGVLILSNWNRFSNVDNVKLNVSVIDGVYSSETVTNLVVFGANENDPKFPKAVIDAVIQENLAPGMFVTKVTAVDEDPGDSEQLSYFFETERMLELFRMEEHSGEIYTIKSLDREVVSQYEFWISAKDPGGRVGFALLKIRVLDDNDNKPEFILREYSANIYANLSVGESVLKIQALDVDSEENSLITYSIVDSQDTDLFTIDSQSGDITLAKSLEGKENEVYQFFVRAEDKGDDPLSSEVPVTVIIMGLGDKPPKLVSPNTRYFVLESSPIGCLIARARLLEEISSPVQLSIVSTTGYKRSVKREIEADPQSGREEMFAINEKGEITLLRSLDTEKQDTFILMVKASTSTSPNLSDIVPFVIQVTDSNDSDPVFDSQIYRTEVPEDTPRETTILKVTAEDADIGANQVIAYQFAANVSEEVLSKFKIDSTSGWISTVNLLDREQMGRYEFNVIASDNGFPRRSSLANVVIDVGDINDNPPVFTQTRYFATVNEDVDIGTTLVTLAVTDQDLTASRLLYYITSGDSRSQFSIKPNGALAVIKPLDREDIKSYKLRVAATDGIFVAWTSVSIDVIDDNDNPPYCSKFRYKESVPEDAPLGTLVFKVETKDVDENEESRVRYFLTGRGAEDFSIDSTSGEVKIARMLDRESQSKYRLVSHVQDLDKLLWECTADVIIIVSDVNDNRPQFKVENLTALVPEDLEVKSLITKVHASDYDEGNNRRVRYSFPASTDDHFMINDVSGIITLAKSLDRESNIMHNLTVIAKDQGSPQLSSTAFVTVVVLDVNDNPPEFESKTYFSAVPEDAHLGTEVIKVFATSLDTGVNAEIIYSILGGNEHRKFTIDPNTGSVTLVEGLDFERANDYYLTIQAIDRGTPPLSNHATLNITIIDINDNKPIFSHPSYVASIREDAPVGEAVVKVASNDPDSGDNGRITYTIQSGDKMGQFSINPDIGVVIINTPLDREMAEQYTLEVEARDNGVPSLASSVQVVIDVLDANDNPPQFSQSNYTTIAQEDKPLGFVILRLQVSDADTPVNGAPFNFEITHGNDDNSFRLDADGLLRMARPLNHRMKDTYLLGVRVYDHGIPPLHSDTWVTVKVIEESRFSPIITPLEIAINTYGDEFSGGIIGKVHATDQDPYDSLTFSIVKGPSLWHLFEIDKDDGTLIVKPGLDAGEYALNISVSDGKYFGYSTVSVSVTSITKKSLENSVVMTLRDVTLEDFIQIYRKNFIKTIRNLMQVRSKDVSIISIQVNNPSVQRAERDSIYSYLNMTYPVWRTRENHRRPNIDVLFTVQKSGADFYSPSAIREQLTNNLNSLENGMKVYVAQIAESLCKGSHCLNGKCEDRVALTDELTSVVTERLSFVTPKHVYSPVCVCQPGYIGERCEVLANECLNNPCATPLICMPINTTPGYTCKCPDGFSTTTCGVDATDQCLDGSEGRDQGPCYTPRSPLSFSGKSYAQYSLATSIDKKLIVSLRLRTVQLTGNIMFLAGRVDYSILEMVNGQVQYRFDCGSGEGLVRVSGTYVNDGKWHEVRLQRHGNKAELFIDGRFSAHGSAPGVNDVLNMENTDVYFGAEVRQLPGLPGFDDTRMGFIGCLDDIRVDRTLLPYHISGNYIVAASVPIGVPAPAIVATLRRFKNVEFICRHSLIWPGLCGSQPRLNGGSCIEVSGVTYQCKCHERFFGAKCEIDSDPCASSPCLYGGFCFNLQNDYRCQCPENLTGKRCEYGRFCRPNPCKNGGICEEGISGPICKCRGFTGELCNTDINECEPNPCHSGGVCLNMFGTFRCSCPPNATGQYCSESIGIVGGIFGAINEIPQEVTVGILATLVSLVLILMMVCACYCRNRRKRRRHRRYFDSNGREMMPLNSTRDCDYSKKLTKNSNLEAVASQVPPMLPPRPSSYSPSGNEQNYVALNNLDTIRSYGSAGDELETLPMLNSYAQSEFSNLNGGQVHEAFGLDEGELRKQPWPEMEHNLAGKYYEKIHNDFKMKPSETSCGNKISNLKPNNKEMTVAYVSSTGRAQLSSTEDCAPRDPGPIDVPPPVPPLPRDYAEFLSSLEKHLANRRGYHWDVSDWANASVTTDIAEVVGGSMVDAASCHSHETSDYNYGSKVPGPPLDENGRLAIREPPVGACDASLRSPTEQVSFEQIIARSGLRLSQLGTGGSEIAPLSEISDLNDSLPSPGNYAVHPNLYLPAHKGVQSETDVEMTYADDSDDDDAPSLLSVSIPSQIRLPDERLSLSTSYAARQSMSDISNVCDLVETDCEEAGEIPGSVMQTAL
ncbi:fat-like cadherin-related tumor suppressor homolog isoform X5 [Artemia franciscana]|uniref:fat-like cadherin-related tumor suppressor homolog isoform X5 n=1 Tax=Artemia franciscana TaxID=6661 RepID=UPI0032DB706F